MAILIGVDEAGYGPNLGPLVVAATAWQAPDEKPAVRRRSSKGSQRAAASSPAAISNASSTVAHPHRTAPDLYALLADAVTNSPGEAARVAIADSKTLYKPGGGWRLLERGVLAAWAILSENSRRFSERIDHVQLIAALRADPRGLRELLPWQHDAPIALPRDDARDVINAAADSLRGACQKANVRFLGSSARLVYPAEFNDLVDRCGTKGAALSHVTLALVRDVVDESCALVAAGREAATRTPEAADCTQAAATDAAANDQTVQITCDKHGGRNCYAGLLQHHFPEAWIDVLQESRPMSRYTWRHGAAACEATFRVGGEAEMPTALASMTAKYLRELAMHEFNAYWTERVPGLRPTAGYPVDARRFKADIAAEQRRLGIEDRVLWRSR